IEAAPLEGLEEIEIDGTLYEAFNTSGGLGSLAETYGARTQVMDYKTMRYPGHCEQMRLLMNDLKLNHDRGTLKRILENAVPQTLQDVVVIYVAVTGKQDGDLREENYVKKVYPQMIAGRLWGPGVEKRGPPCRVRAPGRFSSAGRAAKPLRQALRCRQRQGNFGARRR